MVPHGEGRGAIRDSRVVRLRFQLRCKDLMLALGCAPRDHSHTYIVASPKLKLSFLRAYFRIPIARHLKSEHNDRLNAETNESKVDGLGMANPL